MKKSSEPILVSVAPKTPPVKSVFKTADFTVTFGGVNVSFKNPNKADLAIVVMRDTAGNGKWVTVSTFYTAAVSGNFAARGFHLSHRNLLYLSETVGTTNRIL